MKDFSPFCQFFLNYPATLLLLSVLVAILPPLYFLELSLAWVFVFPLILNGVAFFFLPWRACTLGLILGMIAGFSILLTLTPPPDHYVHTMNGHASRVNGVLRVTDATLVRDAPWLPQTGLMEAEILSVGADSHCGKVLLRRPLTDTSAISFYQTYAFDGTLSFPSPAVRPSDFDFSTYLLSRGALAVLYTDSLIPMDSTCAPGIFATLWIHTITFRDWALHRMTSSIPEAYRGISAALFFGCKQGMDKDSKTKYIQSGTIHIFVVSGLHMALLGGILYGVLCFVPYRYRGLCVSVLLFGYLATTGFQPSAFRAWIMFTLFMLTLGHLRSTRPINTLMLAGIFLLIFQPYSWFDLGFRYSFAVTFFLILSWDSIKSMSAMLTEHISWVPIRFQKRSNIFKLTLIRYVFQPFCSCSVAMLAAVPISMTSYGMFIPFSALLNLCVIPLVGLIMFTGIFCIVLGPVLPWVATLFTYSVATLDYFCVALGDLTQDFAIRGSAFGLEYLVIWGVLFAISMVLSRRVLLISTCAMATLFFTQYVFQLEPVPSLRVACYFGERLSQPAVLFCLPSSKQTVLINLGDIAVASSLPNALRQDGIGKINTVILMNPNASHSRGIRFLCETFPIENIVSFRPPHRLSTFAKDLPLIRASGVHVSLYAEPDSSVCSNSFYTFHFDGTRYRFDTTRASVSWYPRNAGGFIFEFTDVGGTQSLIFAPSRVITFSSRNLY